MASIVYSVLYWTTIKYQIQYTKLNSGVHVCREKKRDVFMQTKRKKSGEEYTGTHMQTLAKHSAMSLKKEEIMKEHTNK